MNLQELAVETNERWNLESQVATDLLAKVQAADGNTVTLPKDGMVCLCQAIIASTEENFELMNAIKQAVDQQEAATIPTVDAAMVTLKTVATAQAFNNKCVDYIESIGRAEEFQKYLEDNGLIK